MKKIAIITGICISVFIFSCSQLIDNSSGTDARGKSFAGPGACVSCHSNVYNSYLNTAHYKASAAANEKTIHGSFAGNNNEFIVNDSQKVVMEKLDSGLYQTYYFNGKVKARYRFDIVFGGVKGESYLYWKGNELCQMPLSYFQSRHQWSTNPGFGYNFLDYNMPRYIGKQCLECHASYINNLPEETTTLSKGDQFDKNSLVYSVDCERCHGPCAKHVDFQTQNPGIKTAAFVTTFSSLNRIQKMDMCAACHSGKPSVMLRSSFEFVPGDTFANFKVPEFIHPADTAHLDVHGNQFQLLQSSKCYLNSKMDCATCHDPHISNSGNGAMFTQKCLTCHNTPGQVTCKMAGHLSDSLMKKNCIGCHMPALPTKIISVQVSDKLPSVQFFVHTHHIATYPEEVKKIMNYIRKPI
jgi:hypothetical protein